MGLIDNIKRDADGNRTIIQKTEDAELEGKLNQLFYLPKNIEKETEFVHNVMTRGQETEERKGLHASAIIVSDNKFCYRQQVLSLFYKQLQGEQVEVGLKRIFSEGDSIHEKWQRLFIRGGYSEPDELDVTQYSPEYDLQYTPDILCTIDGEEMVGEIKSMNTYAFQKMVKTASPHPSGEKQLQLYLWLTGREKGFTLCEDKNTQNIKVKVVKADISKITPFINRLENIQYYKERLQQKGRLVKRHDLCTGYKCDMAQKCPMREVCYGRSRERLS